MKKIASWLVESFEKTNTKFDDIIAVAVSHKNELNENDKSELDAFLDDMRDNGWYPFVSKILENANNIEKFDYVFDIKKDPYIWELYMLEKEYHVLEGFGTIDIEDVKAKIKKFKAAL